MVTLSPPDLDPNNLLVAPEDYTDLCRHFRIQAGAKLLPKDMSLTEIFFKHGLRGSGLLMRMRLENVLEPVVSFAVMTPKVWSYFIRCFLTGKEPEDALEMFDDACMFSEEHQANILAGLLLALTGNSHVASVARFVPESYRTKGYISSALQRGDSYMANVIGHATRLTPRAIGS